MVIQRGEFDMKQDNQFKTQRKQPRKTPNLYITRSDPPVYHNRKISTSMPPFNLENLCLIYVQNLYINLSLLLKKIKKMSTVLYSGRSVKKNSRPRQLTDG